MANNWNRLTRRRYLSNAGVTSILLAAAGCMREERDGDVGEELGTTAEATTTASVTTDTTSPSISSFAVSNPSGTDVQVKLQSSEQLDSLQVTVNGPEAAVLDESDFQATEAENGGYEYNATYETSSAGTYNVALEVAEDASGNDGVDGQTAQVTVDSSPASVSSFSLANPSDKEIRVSLTTDETLQTLSVQIQGPDETTLGLADFQSEQSGDSYTYVATYVTEQHGSYTARLTTAAGESGNDAAEGQIASVTTDESAPTITTYRLSNPTGQRVRVALRVDKKLAGLRVTISGPEAAALESEDFSVSETDSGYGYVATYEGSSDGTYEATLENAVDASGNDAASGQSASLTVDTTPATISSFSLANPTGRTIRVALTVSERLQSVRVRIHGAGSMLLERGNFSVSETDSGYRYVATYEGPNDGTYEATLENAVDTSGNDAAAAQSRDVDVGGADPSDGNEALSFEDGSVGTSNPPSPWRIVRSSGSVTVHDNASDGDKSIRLSSKDGLDPIAVAVDVDLTDVSQILADMYPVSVSPSNGYVKFLLDAPDRSNGHLHCRDHPGRTAHGGAHTEAFRDGEWHYDIEFFENRDSDSNQSLADITGTHQLILHASGDNQVIWDNIRFEDGNGDLLELSDVVDSTDGDDGGNDSGSASVQSFEEFETGSLPPQWSTEQNGGGTTGVISASNIQPDARDGDNVLAVSWNGDGNQDTIVSGPLKSSEDSEYQPNSVKVAVYDTNDAETGRFAVSFLDSDGNSLFGAHGTAYQDKDRIAVNGEQVADYYFDAGWHTIRFHDISWADGTLSVDIDDGAATATGVRFSGSGIQQMRCRAHGFDSGDLLFDNVQWE